jgi:hypothetical protein
MKAKFGPAVQGFGICCFVAPFLYYPVALRNISPLLDLGCPILLGLAVLVGVREWRTHRAFWSPKTVRLRALLLALTVICLFGSMVWLVTTLYIYFAPPFS